jgi:hypothetical protein
MGVTREKDPRTDVLRCELRHRAGIGFMRAEFWDVLPTLYRRPTQ